MAVFRQNLVYQYLDLLFAMTADRKLIADYLDQMLRVAALIKTGKLLPSTILRRQGTPRHLSFYLTEHINQFGLYEWNPQRITSPLNYDLEILLAPFR